MNGTHLTADIFAFIQARTGSTRFPDKVLKRIPESGQTVLGHIISRLGTVLPAENIVILIPLGDTRLASFCQAGNIPYMEGPELDVRQRYINAALKYNTEGIIRLTGDNPFIDIEHIEMLIEAWLEKQPDLVSFSGLPLGMGAELFGRKALCSEPASGLLERHREHVSLHIKEYPENFSIFKLTPFIPPARIKLSENTRMTMDEEADYEVLSDVWSRLRHKPLFGAGDILDLYLKEPQLFEKNRNVEQVRFQLPLNEPGHTRILLLFAPVAEHGSGHYERCKIISVFLELNGYQCTLADSLPAATFDAYIIDSRDIPVPDGIDKKRVLLLDNLGIDRTNCTTADFLFSPSYEIHSGIFPAILNHFQNAQEKDYILVYAGSLDRHDSNLLDQSLSVYDKKIIRIGGTPPENQDIQYLPRTSRSGFYKLLSECGIFVTYPGTGLQEGIFLRKNILLYSFSEIHQNISLYVSEYTGIYYTGDLTADKLDLPAAESIVASRIILENNGLEEILNKIKCILV